MNNADEYDAYLARLDGWVADPATTVDPSTVHTGEASRMAARQMLVEAGVDVEVVERRGGRPRVGDGAGHPGRRSPRLNVAVSAEVHDLVTRAAAARGGGTTRSDIVREALDEYLSTHLTG